MREYRIWGCCGLLYAMVLALAGLGSAYGAGITVHAAWVAVVTSNQNSWPGFMVIENTSAEARHLVGARSSDAERIHLAGMKSQGRCLRVVQQPKLPIPANGRLELKPGAYHLMIIHPRPLRSGDYVRLILEIDNGERISVDAEVRWQPIGDPKPPRTQ